MGHTPILTKPALIYISISKPISISEKGFSTNAIHTLRRKTCIISFVVKKFKKDIFLLPFFILIFIGLRSMNFIHYLSFIGWDQAAHSLIALNIFTNKDFVLIGPEISAISYLGRNIFLGPLYTYMMVCFLFFGGWDPVKASYLFTIFSGLMVVPLFYGVKWLIGKKSAWIMVTVYTLLPYYLTYTRFLWNPNFQFALLPILFLLMGLYKNTKNNWFLFLISFWQGLILQLHYQFIICIALLGSYYFAYKKEGLRKFAIFISGLLLGFSPILVFELRNQFYNTKTIWLFFQHFNELDIRGERDHYWLSISFVVLLGLLGIINDKIKKLRKKTSIILFALLFSSLFLLALRITINKPASEFWAPVINWNYSVEYKIYEIIKSQNLKYFNVTNQLYDSKALTQKYFLKRDGVKIDYDDYYHEKYLFVVDKKGKKNFMENPGYEVLSFKPYKLLRTWEVNDYYELHLVERLSK